MSSTRQEIIKAARKLLSHFGPSKTSVEEIAREAGLSKATVYNHFSGKEAIVAGVIEYERKVFSEKLNAAVESADDPVAGLRAYFVTHSRETKQIHDYYKLGIEEITDYMPQVAKAFEAGRKHELSLLRKILEKGIEADVFRPMGDLNITARILHASILGLNSPLFSRLGGRGASKRLDYMLEIFLEGLCSEAYRTAVSHWAE